MVHSWTCNKRLYPGQISRLISFWVDVFNHNCHCCFENIPGWNLCIWLSIFYGICPVIHYASVKQKSLSFYSELGISCRKHIPVENIFFMQKFYLLIPFCHLTHSFLHQALDSPSDTDVVWIVVVSGYNYNILEFNTKFFFAFTDEMESPTLEFFYLPPY